MIIESRRQRKRNPSEIIKTVRDYEQSGLSPSEYAREAGLAASTFNKWVRQHQGTGGGLSFAEVGAQTRTECEIKLLNGRQLVIRGSYSPKQVSALVRELEGC